MDGRGVGLFATEPHSANIDLKKVLAHLDKIANNLEFREKMKALGRSYLSQHASSGIIKRHDNQQLATWLRDYDPPSSYQPLDHWGELLKIYKQFAQPGTLSDNIEQLWIEYFGLNQKFVKNLILTTPIGARHHYFSQVLTDYRSMWVLREEIKRLERSFQPQARHETPSV